MSIEEKYEHAYVYSEMITDMQETIYPYLGYGNAESEWSENPQQAHNQFIKINSYEEFSDPSTILLIGRIGTGKTSILNNLKYLIEREQENRYKFVTMVESSKYFFQLSRSIRLSEHKDLLYAEIEELLIDKWNWLINVTAMQEMNKKFPNTTKKIKKYLEDNNLVDYQQSTAYIIDAICDNVEDVDNKVVQGAVALRKIMRRLYSVDFKDAEAELKDTLKDEGNCLILIDTIDKYHVDDTISLAVISALYAACVNFSNSYSRDRILVKIALPSEIMPNLITINTEKIVNRIVYIRWNQKDLTKLIAIRLFSYKHQEVDECSIDEALTYFHEYYSETCITETGIVFNTMAYCLMHTQKKPRQLLSIYNSWLFLEKQYPGKDRMELISNAVHLNQELMIKGALSIYVNQNSRVFEIFKRVFAGSKYCFSASELDAMIKNCSSVRGEMDAFSVKRMLLSSGLLGIQQELHYINENNEYFKNIGKIIRIKEVVFEYQLKDQLPINGNSTFALHPICYRVTHNIVDENTIVYPKPAGDEFVPWQKQTS